MHFIHRFFFICQLLEKITAKQHVIFGADEDKCFRDFVDKISTDDGLGKWIDDLSGLRDFKCLERGDKSTTRQVLLREYEKGNFKPEHLNSFNNAIENSTFLRQSQRKYITDCISSFQRKWVHTKDFINQRKEVELRDLKEQAEKFVSKLERA